MTLGGVRAPGTPVTAGAPQLRALRGYRPTQDRSPRAMGQLGGPLNCSPPPPPQTQGKVPTLFPVLLLLHW